MKKNIILILMLLGTIPIEAQEVYFDSKIIEHHIKSILHIADNERLNKQVLDTIQILDLSGIGIDTITDITKFPNLRRVNLSNNNLKELKDFVALSNLEYIDLSDNNLESIDDILECNTDNLTINITHNYIKDFSFVKYSPTTFLKVIGENMQIKRTDKPLVFLNYLNVYNNETLQKTIILCDAYISNRDKANLDIIGGDSYKIIADGLTQKVELPIRDLSNIEIHFWYDNKKIIFKNNKLNNMPIANAGTPQTVQSGTLVTLDGSASSDINDLTYKWTAPNGVVLSDVTAVQPTFTAPKVDAAMDYTFTLIVNNGKIDSESAKVVITVEPSKPKDDDKDGITNDKDECLNTPEGESVDEKGCGQSQYDDDEDGVINGRDKCPDTPKGIEVNEYGCSAFKLPKDNFTIEVSDETCYGQNNGVLSITTKEEHPYKVIIGDESYEFTKDFMLNTLSPNDYEFCISVENTDYKQCFEFIIKKGYQLRAETQLRNRKMSVNIEEGTAPFEVYVNNRLEKTTDDMNFDLLVQHGDKIEIRSQKRCEGTLEERVWLFTDIKAYPNPTPTGRVRLSIPVPDINVRIDICNAGGMVFGYNTYRIQNGIVELDLQNYPSGVYIVKIYLEKMVSIKIVKQ